MTASNLPAQHGFRSGIRSFACPVGVGVLMGLVFMGGGFLLDLAGWLDYEPLDLFAMGFACGFVAAVVAAVTNRGLLGVACPCGRRDSETPSQP